MAGFEIDPLFCKALKLLHSATKDSADQIMQLLEEVIEQKYGGTKSLNLKYGSLLFEEPTKIVEPHKSSKPSRGSSPVQSASTTGPSNEKSSRESSSPSEPMSTRTSPDLDDGDLALEIFEDDLNCTVCKGMSVGARNRLVECSDCHLLYHQECHKPPISEADVNDPRVVWYCSDCTKKNQEKVQPKVKTSVQEPALKKPKTESTHEGKNLIFKRSEKSSSSSSSSHAKSSSNSGSGLAHLAATIQGSKSSSTSSSSSSSSSSSKNHSSSSSSNKTTSLNYSKTPGSPNPKSQSSSSAPRSNIISADKRLQNMKKKAAAKFQEKRAKHK